MSRASTRTEESRPEAELGQFPGAEHEDRSQIMMAAAAAMTGPLLAWPVVTARWLRLGAVALLPWRHSSWIG